MKSSFLMLAVERLLIEAVKEIEGRVYLHALPENGLPANFPFVVLRFADGETEDVENEDSLLIHVGIHEPDSIREAGLVCLDLADTIRRALWSTRLVDEEYELRFPIRVKMPDQEKKQHEFHMFTVVAQWQYPNNDRALESDCWKTSGVITGWPKESI